MSVFPEGGIPESERLENERINEENEREFKETLARMKVKKPDVYQILIDVGLVKQDEM